MSSHKYSYTSGNVIFFTYKVGLLQRTFLPLPSFFFCVVLFKNTFCPTSEVVQGSRGKSQPQLNQTIPDMGLLGGLNLCSQAYLLISVSNDM